MYEAHDALLCIGEKTYVDEKNRKKYSDQHYINQTMKSKIYSPIFPKHLENNYNFPFRFSFKVKKIKTNSYQVFKFPTNVMKMMNLHFNLKGLKNRLENFVLKNVDKSKLKKLEKFILKDYHMS